MRRELIILISKSRDFRQGANFSWLPASHGLFIQCLKNLMKIGFKTNKYVTE